MSDISELKRLQAEAKQLGKALDAIAKAKLSNPAGIEHFSKAMDTMPPPETWAAAVADFRTRAARALEAVASARREGFKRYETEFIRSRQGAGVPVSEVDKGWRVGPVQLELRREAAQARALYNREEVVKWRPIGSSEDLAKLEGDALKALEKWRLKNQQLADVFAAAAAEALRRRAGKNGSSRAVPIKEFLAEVRLELARLELQGGKFGKKIPAEFPPFAMLYNLDVYRGLGSSVPGNRRVAFESGSQAEQSRNLGVVINGLRPQDQYKVACYATPPAGGR